MDHFYKKKIIFKKRPGAKKRPPGVKNVGPGPIFVILKNRVPLTQWGWNRRFLLVLPQNIFVNFFRFFWEVWFRGWVLSSGITPQHVLYGASPKSLEHSGVGPTSRDLYYSIQLSDNFCTTMTYGHIYSLPNYINAYDFSNSLLTSTRAMGWIGWGGVGGGGGWL